MEAKAFSDQCLVWVGGVLLEITQAIAQYELGAGVSHEPPLKSSTIHRWLPLDRTFSCMTLDSLALPRSIWLSLECTSWLTMHSSVGLRIPNIHNLLREKKVLPKRAAPECSLILNSWAKRNILSIWRTCCQPWQPYVLHEIIPHLF